MKQFIIETLTHFPGCFAACVLSHWIFHLFTKRKDKVKLSPLHSFDPQTIYRIVEGGEIQGGTAGIFVDVEPTDKQKKVLIKLIKHLFDRDIDPSSIKQGQFYTGGFENTFYTTDDIEVIKGRLIFELSLIKI